MVLEERNVIHAMGREQIIGEAYVVLVMGVDISLAQIAVD